MGRGTGGGGEAVTRTGIGLFLNGNGRKPMRVDGEMRERRWNDGGIP